MFCTKCGNQLPDGAQFCTKCGSKMESAPTPVAPAQPVITEQPVLSSQPFVNPALAPAKKSKAPLFIGIGIGALILIIAVTLIIILTSGDNEDDNVNKQTTTSSENSTEEGTEIPTSGSNTGAETDLDKATEVAKDFMEYLIDEDTKLVELLTPGMMDYAKTNDFDEDVILSSYLMSICDSSFNVYDDYKVLDAKSDDGSYFKDNAKDFLEAYDSYIEPTDFATVEVEFTHNGETASAYLYITYCDGDAYILDFDTSDIEFEEETTGNDGGTDEWDMSVSDMLTSNSMDLLGGDFIGTVVTENGYSIKIPDGWSHTTSNNLPYYTAPDSKTWFNINVISGLADVNMVEYFEQVKSMYEGKGLYDIEFGTLETPVNEGYYTEYYYLDGSGNEILGYQYLFINDAGTLFALTLESYDEDSDYFATADRSVATMTTP